MECRIDDVVGFWIGRYPMAGRVKKILPDGYIRVSIEGKPKEVITISTGDIKQILTKN
jgi:hypothetical protein